MKLFKNSFPFLFIFLLCFCTQNSYAIQQPADSLLYYYPIINQPTNHTDLSDAFTYFEKKRKESLREKDTLNAIFYARYVAEVQNKLGFLYESEVTTIEALKLLDLAGGKDTLIEPRIGLYNHLGMLCRQRHDYDKALYYYNNSLNIAITEEHRYAVWNNMANVYKDQRKYDKAIVELEKVYGYAIQSKNDIILSRSLNNLGVVQAKLGLSEGLSNMEKALALRKKINYIPGIITSYTHLIDYYLDNGRREKAAALAEEARKVAYSSNNPKWRSHVLSRIIDLKEDPDVLAFKKYTDSVSNADLMQRNKYISAKYNFEAQERRARESELQRVKERSRRIVFQFVLLFIILISFLVYRYLRIRQKRKILQEVSASEARISRKMHDEIANDMYRVMTNLQTRHQLSGEILDDLDDIYSRTRDISREIQTPESGKDYADILKGLLLQFRTEKVNIILNGLSGISWDSVKEDKKRMLYKILQELMVNMRKHSEASVVLLQFRRSGKNVLVEYKDNGKGCDLGKGSGLTNAETRMKLVGGTISFVSEPGEGFRAKIII
ncbi:tetratricopeptide repeat-containing sensor histidine kinase [Sinomicrobium pectinilyticum]|uniref:histidine kinase n=1 Tax=Sinomicrobium pectinilyticum TaxID=1084421 RepID=A0A3N0EK22_SINP1|nr:tetratricopeptide repeat-containing sensor histidine kinase [Sinomicrobium pectinilyticum]RNL88243.1 tetratricopeptide repeat-containing sensor histidine kinase [Sinomicrobium pectinilyticum]